MADIQTQIKSQMAAAVAATVVDPNVQAEKSSIPALIEALTPVAESVANSILHSTNNEPWWQSRIIWGQIITAAGLAAAGFGVTVNASTQELLVSLAVPLAGIAVTLYGRLRAKKPIGS
ncbi:hypothetical protein RHSP_32190 [Rhizobium freirei PRF 81]|uniref:Transmembrane protein n=1 Tax=Rhizobium freirei PRF 81 TaxID=363754 RepID=N6V524_9HYPH|nr:hypothetical protein [Rhizobium freirei]ENN86092.1 hypothetical protein RHSP_32190 [Rhizobium freirei PRF 81]